MSGIYWKLADDGAQWRCSECGELKPHDKVILFESTETGGKRVFCLDCVDQEWLAAARCLGTK